MKKIVSALALAAVAAGFATAEVKISANFRAGQNLLNHQFGHATTLLDQDGKRTESDAIVLKGSAEYGGFEFELDPINNMSGSSRDAEGSGLKLEKYNGWINFGPVMLKMGTWDSRAVGRVNADIGNHEGKYWGELKKPGLAAALGTSGLGTDVSQQSDKYPTTMVQYTNKDLGIEARAAYANYRGDTNYYANDNDIDFAVNRFMFEAGYTVKDVGRILATTKATNYDWVGALFFEPKLANLKQLTALVGVTYERNVNAGTDSKGDDLTAQAIAGDLRVRYAINDQLSVTGMFNWTGGDKVSSNKLVNQYATWGMLNVTYKLNDTFQPFCSAIYASGASKAAVAAKAFDDPYAATLRIYPGVSIFQTKNANLIAGVAFDIVDFTNDDFDNHENMYISVPLLMRVKF